MYCHRHSSTFDMMLFIFLLTCASGADEQHLAPGLSELVTGPLTLHTLTAIHIAQMMTGAKFQHESVDNSKAWKISCDGIGYVNPFLCYIVS